MTKFKFLSGDVNWIDYGGKFVSKKLNNGEFDYWLVLELTNLDDACGRDNEGKSKYHVSLSCVSPSEAGQENVDKACEGYGGEPLFDLGIVDALHSYGISAHLYDLSGNNAHTLLKEAKKEANKLSLLFGFAMDRAVNRLGTTGWNAVRGNITAGLSLGE